MIEALDILNSGHNFKAELARRNLADFIAYVRPDFVFNWHHTLIIEQLQDIVEGNIDKNQHGFFTPPQVGKSTIISQLFPAWLMGRNPNEKIILASYGYVLASRNLRAVKDIMESPEYKQVFPDTCLNDRNVVNSLGVQKTKDFFELQDSQGKKHKGYCKSVGAGQGLTGFQATTLIADDIIASMADAMSDTTCSKLIDWWDSVFKTRIQNDGKVFLMMTRWATTDIASHLLKREINDWSVITLEAIKENDYPYDPRKKGEPLWEARHSLKLLNKIKKNNPKVFQSLYQQSPQPSNDILIFGHATRATEMPNEFERIMGVDFGFSNSQTAIADIEIDRKRKIIWAKEVFYEVGASNSDIATVVKPYKILCYCDSAEPKSIAELKNLGVNALPAKKFPNSVLTQILFLQDFEINYIGNNADFEKRHYQWQIGADGLPINQEVDKYNHFWKAVMYAVYTHLAGDGVVLQSNTHTYKTQKPVQDRLKIDARKVLGK